MLIGFVPLQGYIANRNRTLKHLYDNNIDNNVFLAGDSHQNWVSGIITKSPTLPASFASRRMVPIG